MQEGNIVSVLLSMQNEKQAFFIRYNKDNIFADKFINKYIDFLKMLWYTIATEESWR